MEQRSMCGGASNVKEMTDEVVEICNQVKGDVESKTKRTLEEFTPKHFRSQIVAGINYFVKVHIGNTEHLHLRIYKNLQGQVSLHSLQEGKSETDELDYF